MAKTPTARAKRMRAAVKAGTAGKKSGYIGAMPNSAMVQAQQDALLSHLADGPLPADEANPKDAYGEAKVDLSLIPPASAIYQALAMGDGARKYGPYNWRGKKVKMMVYLAAAKRHIDKIIDGQDIDEESGKPELGHALASLGIIADAMETGNLIDNRPPPGACAKLLQKWKRPVAK